MRKFTDGVPYSCQFDGRPIKVQSGDDVFVVALPPPCPTVCDKRPAGPELLAKLGLRPMHTLGSMPGHLGSAGPLGVSQGSPGVNGAADSGPTNSVRGVAGVSSRARRSYTDRRSEQCWSGFREIRVA